MTSFSSWFKYVSLFSVNNLRLNLNLESFGMIFFNLQTTCELIMTSGIFIENSNSKFIRPDFTFELFFDQFIFQSYLFGPIAT